MIDNFTAAPVYLANVHKEAAMNGSLSSGVKCPAAWNASLSVLDETLRKINSDYDAKRSHDLALVAPAFIP